MESCNLCGSTERRTVGNGQGFRFLECSACGLQWSAPFPTNEEISRFYENFFAGQRAQEEFAEYVALAENSLRHQLQIAQIIAPSLTVPGRFLDVGCGGGHYVRAAEKLGWEAYGVEVDASAVESIRARGLKNIHFGYLHESPFESGSFDIIKAMHVLEHCKDPTALLWDIAGKLRPEGVLIVDVPNQSSPIAKFKVALRKIGVGKNGYGYLQPPIHLHAFTPKTLARILEKAGFQVAQLVYTSPLDPLHFPTTKSYYASPRWRLVRLLYRIAGAGSYISVYATKAGKSHA